MKRVRGKWLLAALLFLMHCSPTLAQNPDYEFFPEVDAYLKVNSSVQVYFQAKDTREGGDPTQVEIGPSIEFYLRPLIRLKDVTKFDLNDAKSRPLVFAIGYRYVPSPDKPTVNRLEPVITFHYPLVAHILLTDRNRADLDWSSGPFNWRYRNRVTLERRFSIHSYHPAPYASAEFFYESQYSKWSTTALYAGCLLPIGRHVQLDPYYEHENNTGKAPNQQINAFGIVLNLLFDVSEKKN